jgi:hypothetical protein
LLNVRFARAAPVIFWSMKLCLLCLSGAFLFAASQLVPGVSAQSNDSPTFKTADVEGKDVQNELQERQQKISKLSTEEQLRLRAAEVKAAEDPEVLAALEKRKKAIDEFRDAFRKSILKNDPGIEPLLDRVAVGGSPGF